MVTEHPPPYCKVKRASPRALMRSLTASTLSVLVALPVVIYTALHGYAGTRLDVLLLCDAVVGTLLHRQSVPSLRSYADVQQRHTTAASAGGTWHLAWGKGLSVSFLEQFVLEHGDELAFLSTDAVVERLVKPRTKSTGVALIETVPEDLRGTPGFFLTHAWRSTFHVSVQHPFSMCLSLRFHGADCLFSMPPLR